MVELWAFRAYGIQPWSTCVLKLMEEERLVKRRLSYKVRIAVYI